MDIRKFVPSFLLLALLVLTIPNALCVSEDWVEVISFNGTIWPESTERFIIDCFDWRIKWSYTPRLHDSFEPYIFRMDVRNASGYVVEFIFASNQIAGTVNMNQTGEYYLYIDPMHAENYSITIEQNKNSLPQPEADWIEVLRFNENGLSTETTETFVINHVDWRIHWIFESNVDPPPTVFTITVYDSKDKVVDFFVTAFEGNGTLYYNTTGSFYLKIRKNYVENYEVIVEQNIDSIPEFPSWIILPMFLTSTLTILGFKRKFWRQLI